MASPNDEDEIKAYRASLKKPTFTGSPRLLAIFGGALAFMVFLGWTLSWRSTDEAPPAKAVATVASAAPPEPPAPPTARELTMAALQSIADAYAPLDTAALPKAPIELAKGRKVVFVIQSLGFDPETARLMHSSERSPTKIVNLPRGFEPGKSAELALEAKDVGLVVLMRETIAKVGEYSGGKEPAMATTNEMVAVLVPEKKRVAVFLHVQKPKSTATRLGQGKGSILIGNLPDDDEGWMNSAAADLYNGRAPDTTTE
jgi:hypothetical protein